MSLAGFQYFCKLNKKTFWNKRNECSQSECNYSTPTRIFASSSKRSTGLINYVTKLFIYKSLIKNVKFKWLDKKGALMYNESSSLRWCYWIKDSKYITKHENKPKIKFNV